MKSQSNNWVFTIYTSAVKEKHQTMWYDNSIPDSDDPGSPIFCDNFMQDNSTLRTTWKTKSFTGTVSIIDTKARRHNSSEELQTYNHHFQILSKKSDKYKDNWKKRINFPPAVNQGFQKHMKESINIELLWQSQKNHSQIPINWSRKEF